jgi:ABC-type branched-subunit amino acid transport system substrate-binding protein
VTPGLPGGPAHRDEFKARPGVPGVSDKEISFDVVGTKTNNPLGTCIVDCYRQGIEAYFAYRNSEGGIYGRKLVVGKVLDDELGQNQQRSLDVISGNDAFGVFEATLLATGWGDLDQAGIPTYAWGINATEAANRAHIFPSLVVRCADCPRPSVPYVAKQVGAHKAASIGYGVSENSKVCTDTVAKAFDLYEDDSGVKGVYTNDDLDFGLPNGIGPEVTAMKKKGVDFISTCIDLNGMKTLAQELRRQGMDDVVLYHPNSYDQAFVAAAGSLFEGDVVSVQFRPFETDAKGTALAEFQTWMAKAGHEPTELAMVGWINASLAFDGLLAAGPEFDRDRVTAATNQITDFTAGGLLVPIDWRVAHDPYTASDPSPETSDCGSFVKVQDGKFVPLGSAAKPWMCWKAGKKVPFTPTPTNFD